jgi:hypothetical protein
MTRLVLIVVLLAPSAAAAKPRGGRAAAKPAPVGERAVKADRPAPAPRAQREKAEKADDAGGDDAATTTKTADGKTLKTKTYTFGAMDVEGKLKTPQLLYFLNRVKLELDMSAPDKRSFMKELAKSADDKNL